MTETQTQEMTTRGSTWEARTTRDASAWTPPRHVLAARSMLAVERITDRQERAEAFARHLDEFTPTVLLG